MKKRLKEIQNRVKNDPEFQKKLQEMKPKRTLWGFLFILLFFFVPEVVNYLWGLEINEWIADWVHQAPPSPLVDSLLWLSEKSFDGELSLLNIGLGFAVLYWVYRK